MKEITFENIFTLGDIVFENDNYKHVHYSKMLNRYDSNFIEFKSLPSLTTFKKAETFLKDFHLQKGQKYIKFYLPENIKPSGELYDYLTNMDFEIGFLELFAIKPNHFSTVRNNKDIEIQIVTNENLDIFINLKYKNDLEFGNEFARQKTNLIRRQFEEPNIRHVLAYYKGIPAGYVDIILSDKTVEIDELTVDELYRNKGIGSQLQKYVMDSFSTKTVILVADGEDTPKDMYRKQNYQYLGFKYEILKIY